MRSRRTRSYLGVSRDTPMEKTLFAVDELCGFIMACAYVRPEGLVGMTPKSVKKKLKTPAFAAAVSRDDITRARPSSASTSTSTCAR